MAYTADYWISHLQLSQHVEGGHYKRIYQSPLEILKENLPYGFPGNRPVCTHIYFLLQKNEFSAFHKIKSDELWHFYAGDSLIIYEIEPGGNLKEHYLGPDPLSGQSLFTVVPANSWFASAPADEASYSLVGCTVSPGFDFEDFELAKKDELTKLYPQHKNLIHKLTRI
ncbi:MAG: cupin domain-containing protein [Bacteroidetes bacterium]|nr:cupin domain-containing protein [Bacteroidota bacterium]